MVDLWPGLWPTNARYSRGERGGTVGLRVKQVELEFCCHDDLQPHLLQRRDRSLEHCTRIGKIRFAVVVIHSKQCLGRRFVGPRYRRDAAGNEPARRIWVAVIVPDHARQYRAECTH